MVRVVTANTNNTSWSAHSCVLNTEQLYLYSSINIVVIEKIRFLIQ